MNLLLLFADEQKTESVEHVDKVVEFGGGQQRRLIGYVVVQRGGQRGTATSAAASALTPAPAATATDATGSIRRRLVTCAVEVSIEKVGRCVGGQVDAARDGVTRRSGRRRLELVVLCVGQGLIYVSYPMLDFAVGVRVSNRVVFAAHQIHEAKEKSGYSEEEFLILIANRQGSQLNGWLGLRGC